MSYPEGNRYITIHEHALSSLIFFFKDIVQILPISSHKGDKT